MPVQVKLRHSFNQFLASGLTRGLVDRQGRGPDTFSWRTNFPPSPRHIILKRTVYPVRRDRISYENVSPRTHRPGGQIFLQHR